ncbi:hypothetical protein FQN57_003426 [Myotisia sp. PD_48]|nr:hypothetical protein FQN57_003426 [Myotisia sp. PD_48]
MKLTVALCLLAAASPSLGQASSYRRTCDTIKHWQITAGHRLSARCGGPRGRFPTELDLNLCYGNRDGVLVHADNGRAFSTCTIHSISTETGYIDATCPRDNGQRIPANIGTDDFIQNENGRLTCFGHLGPCNGCLSPEGENGTAPAPKKRIA